MGYSTEFAGGFKIEPPLSEDQAECINKFSGRCHWVVSENGSYLDWDGSYRFYNYIEWIEYMIPNFFDLWEVKLNGTVSWDGEESDDRGKIEVRDSKVEVYSLDVTRSYLPSFVSSDGKVISYDY